MRTNRSVCRTAVAFLFCLLFGCVSDRTRRVFRLDPLLAHERPQHPTHLRPYQAEDDHPARKHRLDVLAQHVAFQPVQRARFFHDLAGDRHFDLGLGRFFRLRAGRLLLLVLDGLPRPGRRRRATSRAEPVQRLQQERHTQPAGYGEYQPANGNDSEEGRLRNRRIEIVLMPNLNELPDMSTLKNELK